MNDLEAMRDRGVDLQGLKLRCINLTIFDGSPIDIVFNLGDNVHSLPCTTNFTSKVNGNMVRIYLDQERALKKITLLRHRAYPGRFFGIKFEDEHGVKYCEQVWWQGHLNNPCYWDKPAIVPNEQQVIGLFCESSKNWILDLGLVLWTPAPHSCNL